MGSWMLVTGLASLFAGDFSGMIPEPTGTTAVATNPEYAKLFAELGAGSLVVGIVLVVLIPFLRKLITDKAETPPVEAATVVPVALKRRELPGSARDSRAGDGVLAIANFLPRSFTCRDHEVYVRKNQQLRLRTPCPSWLKFSIPQRLFTVEQQSFTRWLRFR